MPKKMRSHQPTLECWVVYDSWRRFIDCHRRRARNNPSGWPEFLNVLFREGMTRLHQRPQGGEMLGMHVDVFERHAGKKTLKIKPTKEEVEALRQHAENTGYSIEQLIALLLRIGYTSLC